MRFLLLLTFTASRVRAFVAPSKRSAIVRPKSDTFVNINQNHVTNLHATTMPNPFAALAEFFQGNLDPSVGTVSNPESSAITQGQDVIQSFIASLNTRSEPSDLMDFFDDDVIFDDAAYYKSVTGKDNLMKHFYLHSGSSPLSTMTKGSMDMIVVDDVAASVSSSSDVEDGDLIIKVCVLYHLEKSGEDGDIPDSAAITFYTLKNNKIIDVFDASEPPSPKPGNSGLELLKAVSEIVGEKKSVEKVVTVEGADTNKNVVEQYFDAWNRRDMQTAKSLFTEDCVARDTQYPFAFNGRDEFEKHLLNVADCLPSTFDFIVDDISIMPSADRATKEKVGVRWHVENDGKFLPFTRGLSFYTIDAQGLIQSGIEIPERAPPKQGVLNTLSSKFEAEPIRMVPAVMWIAYMYIVFLSDGILPGANALMLEQRTWEEVINLSLNFFLVSPLLHLPFAPVVHPMLEGVFNVLLAWAAMFAGFLSDERKDKPNFLTFGPIVVGMQFLTSAFLLPYLALRSTESDFEDGRIVYKEDISGDIQATVAEWRPLGVFLGSVGSGAIVWSLVARPEFGNFSERYSSFIDLLSIDRVGSSFIVDLAIFAMFQGWFVDDDLSRRGAAKEEMMVLRNAAKFIPFFGLAAYLTFRPAFPSTTESSN